MYAIRSYYVAIVNESAGLLDDLALRAAKGIEIPPDRLNASYNFV